MINFWTSGGAGHGDISYGNDGIRPTYGIYEYGPASLESVTQAPAGGYTKGIVPADAGSVYIVKCSNGSYAKMRINSAGSSLNFDWAYQSNGSTDLR